MKKKMIALLSLAIILFGSYGASAAWLTYAAEPVTNSFTPGKVSCIVTEEFDGSVKKNVGVKSTGNVSAYIRSAIVVGWADTQGNIYAATPKETDYSIELNLTGWFKASDGYYYYRYPVEPGGSTEALITRCTYVQNAPDGYTLQVTILADAIQASGVDDGGNPVVQTVWTAVTVGSSGVLTVREA